MKSAEFGMFPSHINLPNIKEVFGKKSVTEKSLWVTLWVCRTNKLRKEPVSNISLEKPLDWFLVCLFWPHEQESLIR